MKDNKPKGKKAIIWAEVAADIGHVLRKQVVERRQQEVNKDELRRSAFLLTKSLIETTKSRKESASQTPKKVLFIVNHRPRINSQKLKQVEQKSREHSHSSRRFNNEILQKHGGFLQQSRCKEMIETKKREVEMMKNFLQKIKNQNDTTKLHHYRERCYKIWKMKMNTSKKLNTLPSNI